MSKGIHRATPDSVAGRRMTQAKGARVVDGLRQFTADQRAWNAEVERKKQEKNAMKGRA